MHPGKKPTKIVITYELKISFDDATPHGQAFAYYDTDHEVDLLLLLFNGSDCENTLASLKMHVLCRVNDFVFRDVQGKQIVAFKPDVQPTKRQKLLGPSAVVDVFPDFVKQQTFAWFHLDRPVQFLHFFGL